MKDRFCVLGTLCILAWMPLVSGGQQHEPIRGITLSTHTNGGDWAQDGVVPAMKAMRQIGANWVAIHPYAGVQKDGTIRYRPLDPSDPPPWITRPIAEAHALGLKILIKPHLAYWGSGFSWRGEIAFDTPEQWDRFWTTYTAWITAVARVSQKADAFVVGTELEATQDQTDRWRGIIAAVRRQGTIPLTYAANWHAYYEIAFWDDLDAIGIQAYFPIADVPDADDALLRKGWDQRMLELHRYSQSQGKSIVFTELGYNVSFRAAMEPWDYHVDGKQAEPYQLRCLRTALLAIEAEPSVLGCFLWKWFPEPYPVGRNFPLATPGGMSAISRVWRP